MAGEATAELERRRHRGRRRGGRRVNQRIKQCSDDSGCWRGLAGWTTAGLQQNPSHSEASLRFVHSTTIEESLHWKSKTYDPLHMNFAKIQNRFHTFRYYRRKFE